MYLFLIICLFLILLYKFLPHKPLQYWVHELRVVSAWLWEDCLSFFPNTKSDYEKLSTAETLIETKTRSCTDQTEEMTVLDLPELALDCILEKLPPSELCSMAGVCTSLRERCTSDYLWERHMRAKWGKVIGSAARRRWQWHLSYVNEASFLEPSQQTGLMNYISWLWLGRSTPYQLGEKKCSLSADSTMSWYLALETGKFWFPAQVYNRENGHVGFMLSCYDAELSYDSRTDTFQARYPPHGRRAIAVETGVSWDRLRAPPMDTSAHDLHTSDCLDDLRPGDHIEIQWRRNKEFPYGWWYGIVGHLETCERNFGFCRCHESESVVLEFNQYSFGSRWRCTTIHRKDHREEGNEGDGFYGGIRKLDNNDEISTWKRLWPAAVLE